MCKTLYWDHNVGLIPLTALNGPIHCLWAEFPGETGTEAKTVGAVTAPQLRGEATRMLSSLHMCCKNSQVVSQDQQGHYSCEEM